MRIAEYLKQVDQVVAQGPFQATWESLRGHKVPDWYAQGRFGLFIHWGVYSVPAYFNEWYSRLMYQKGSKAYLHHISTYGKQSEFGYKDFIPMFRAEKFDADQWLELFRRSGARYIMPVGEHHDGFKMYNSDLCRYNSVQMGPKRDVLGELKAACERTGMGFCTSSHRAEHYFFFNGGRSIDSDVNDEKYRDFYGPSVEAASKIGRPENGIVPSEDWLEDWLVSTCELIDRYQPLALYFDWWVREPHFRPYMKKFLAYYYNRGVQWGKEVTVFYKWDSVMYGCAVFDVERGQLDSASPAIWQNDTSIGKRSWGYTQNNAYKTPYEIVTNLIDVVSKNGCFMLNVGPKADGTVCEEERRVLEGIGEWMQKNGEGIYGSQPYKTYAEGVTKKRNGSFKENLNYGRKEFRFTYKTGAVYAFAMRPNPTGTYRIATMADCDDCSSFVIKRVTALGFGEAQFTQTSRFLEVTCKAAAGAAMPLCFKIEID